MSRMTPEAWREIEFFTPEEDGWGDWRRLDRSLIYTLDKIRKFARKRFYVHCAYEERLKGWHPKGQAIDGHFEDLHPVEMFEIASRFDEINGLGFYMWWNNPGIHLDTRHSTYKLDYDARWMSLSKGDYLPITANNLRKALD
ncbi:MAG: hypothetical protein GY841_23560 [FCB group bacterium]|nr:hypothetical protein [FCB group bacterium]